MNGAIGGSTDHTAGMKIPTCVNECTQEIAISSLYINSDKHLPLYRSVFLDDDILH